VRSRSVVDAVSRDLDAVEPGQRFRTDVAVVAGTLGHQALADIAAGRDPKAQAVTRVLVHEAEFRAEQDAALGLRDGVEVLGAAVRGPQQDLAGVRRKAAGQHMKKGGLAGAGFADDRQDLAREDLEACIVESRDGPKALVEQDRLEKGGVRGHCAA